MKLAVLILVVISSTEHVLSIRYGFSTEILCIRLPHLTSLDVILCYQNSKWYYPEVAIDMLAVPFEDKWNARKISNLPKSHSYGKHRLTPRPVPPNTEFFLDPFLLSAFLAWATRGKMKMGSEKREGLRKAREMKFFPERRACKGIAELTGSC